MSTPNRAERFADWLYRWKWVLFGAWLVHAFFIHYYLIGMISWDGFGYRGMPVVELLKHGSLNAYKYNDWTLHGHIPFLELLHIPFLEVFGMPGFIIGFPLFVFPLCVVAIYTFVHELIGDRRAATWGAFAYVAIPMINQQPFTAYIDFAVSALLAFFLFGILRLRRTTSFGAGALLVGATFLLTMARSQGVYVVVILFPIVAWVLFFEGRRIVKRRELLLATAAIAIGCLPAIGLQIYKYYEYGSPIAPMQFKLLGIEIGNGVPIDTYFKYAGLGGSDLGSLAKGFFEGWIFAPQWPIGAFFASRFMAAGLLFIIAIFLLPLFLRRATRLELAVLAGGAIVSLLSKDFAVPRWSYTTVLAIVVIFARSMPALAVSRRWRHAYWAIAAIMFLHMLRPEIDIIQIKEAHISPRMNVTGSSHYVVGIHDEVRMYPDKYRNFVILESTGFQLQIYGRRISNDVTATVLKKDMEPGCRNLQRFIDEDRHVLFIDDHNLAKDCQRKCMIQWPDVAWYCGAWTIVPSR